MDACMPSGEAEGRQREGVERQRADAGACVSKDAPPPLAPHVRPVLLGVERTRRQWPSSVINSIQELHCSVESSPLCM